LFYDSVAKVHYEKIYLKFIKNDLKNIFIALFTFILFALNGQEKDSTLNKPSFRGLPFAYYTPDTRWGVGALGIFTFNFNNDSLGARKSNISFGASYTQLNQILLAAPFREPKHEQLFQEYKNQTPKLEFMGISSYSEFPGKLTNPYENRYHEKQNHDFLIFFACVDHINKLLCLNDILLHHIL
jgi:hypothetical protein